jgi:hypothetical protein
MFVGLAARFASNFAESTRSIGDSVGNVHSARNAQSQMAQETWSDYTPLTGAVTGLLLENADLTSGGDLFTRRIQNSLV